MTKTLNGFYRVLRRAPQLLRLGLIAGVLVAAVGMPVAMATGKTVKTGAEFFLEMETELKQSPAGQTSYVYASDGVTPLTMFYEEYRKYIPMTEMSPYIMQAIVAAEDGRYYDHKGVDFKGLARAFVANQTAGEVSQGASTLTMQYVRMALRDNSETPAEVISATEQTSMRKMREIRLAVELEKTASKEEILERYHLIQVIDPTARKELDELLAAAMSDKREAFDLGPDGTWTRRVSTPETPLSDLQLTLLQQVIRG